MIEFIKDYWMLLTAVFAGIVAFFNGKSDIRSHGSRIDRLEENSVKVDANTQKINDIKTNIAVANEQRATTNILLQKMDSHINRLDRKLDRILIQGDKNLDETNNG